jgi:hypothetical protein
MRIAIPDTPYTRPLTERAEAVCAAKGWTLTVTSEAKCATLLRTQSVDLALLSPLGYASAVGRTDERIIPGPTVSLMDYTNIAGVRFLPGAVDVVRSVADEPEAYAVVMMGLLLAERLDAPITVKPRADESDPEAELVFAAPGKPLALDLGEEWFDATDLPLPMAMWVCLGELEDDDIDFRSIVNDLCTADLPEQTAVSEMPEPGADTFPREGALLYRWSPEVEEAVGEVIELLFYHQLIPEIAKVKLLGRD